MDNEEIFEILAPKIVKYRTTHPVRSFLLGICGAQGSGKTTFTQQLSRYLLQNYSLHVLCLSIDDFYLSHLERKNLSQTIHPLLATRGVPGTHHVSKLINYLNSLQHADAHQIKIIPRFNKATDNPFPDTQCDTISGQPDVILFEGWCVGAKPQTPVDLLQPVNELEAQEDTDRKWRTWVNQQLSTSYQTLWEQLDQLWLLQIDSFDKIFEWRLQQELELEAHPNQNRKMTPVELKRFIAHYERITRHILQEMPTRAQVVIQVGENHKKWIIKNEMDFTN